RNALVGRFARSADTHAQQYRARCALLMSKDPYRSRSRGKLESEALQSEADRGIGRNPRATSTGASGGRAGVGTAGGRGEARRGPRARGGGVPQGSAGGRGRSGESRTR